MICSKARTTVALFVFRFRYKNQFIYSVLFCEGLNKYNLRKNCELLIYTSIILFVAESARNDTLSVFDLNVNKMRFLFRFACMMSKSLFL